MEIKLKKTMEGTTDGNETIIENVYVAPPAKARMVRRAVEIAGDINLNNMKAADLDSMVDFTVEVYGKKFTRDDVYDGLDSDELIPTILSTINEIVGTMTNKLGQFPNAQTGK